MRLHTAAGCVYTVTGYDILVREFEGSSDLCMSLCVCVCVCMWVLCVGLCDCKWPTREVFQVAKLLEEKKSCMGGMAWWFMDG